MRYNFAADGFYIINFAADFSSCIVEIVQKTTNLGIYPHFEKVRGSVEPWLTARWKARVEFLFSVIELLFTERHNARIESAVLAIATPSVCLSVSLSVRHKTVLCQNDGT